LLKQLLDFPRLSRYNWNRRILIVVVETVEISIRVSSMETLSRDLLRSQEGVETLLVTKNFLRNLGRLAAGGKCKEQNGDDNRLHLAGRAPIVLEIGGGWIDHLDQVARAKSIDADF
jgi:hypothetical protein